MNLIKGPKFFIYSKLNFKNSFNLAKAYNKILELELFDEEFYTEHYPESNKIGLNPFEYYLLYGYQKGHIPSLNFDPDFYLGIYPDVKYSGMNPLVHYVLYGINENKLIQKAALLVKTEEIANTNLNLLNNHKFENEPLVSIITLNRNGLKHLKRLFKNFKENVNYGNYEIIVVDNGSTDSSVEFLKQLDLPIKIIENKVNVSFSKGNNDAAKIANGEYLLLLNNDIEPTFGWLNEMMGTMLNNDNVAAVGAKLVFPFYFNKKMKKKSFTIQHCGDIFSERIYPCCLYAKNKYNKGGIFDKSINGDVKRISVTGAVMLVKKDVYLEFGGLNEEYNYGLEDVDFILKLYQNNYKTLYCGTALLFHHESSTRINDKNYFENDKNNFNIFWRIWGDYLSKNMLIDKIHQRKFFSEKVLKITFVDTNFTKNNESFEMIKGISNEFYNSGYEIDLVADVEDYFYGSSTDILISFDLNYDIKKIDAREDIVKIFSLNSFNFSKDCDFSVLHLYDIIICSDDSLYDYLKQNISLNKHILKIPNDSYNNYSKEILNNIESILNENDGFL